jgi:shikimate dehydrogenase
VAAVIGHPVGHSLSPAIHNAAFAAAGLDWVYAAFDVAPGQAPAAVAAMRALGIEGLSVTMPHKDGVVGAVDRLSPQAARLGAVNTVVRDGDELVGHNTDGAGLVDSLVAETSSSVAGLRCVVLGAGGSARSVCLALAEAGAADVAVANRTPSRAEVAAALAGPVGRVVEVSSNVELARADLIVNATSVGMAGTDTEGQAPFDASAVRSGQIVVDLVYHPVETPLLAAARERGAIAITGVGMLVHQAAHQFSLWTGAPAPVEAMERAALEALAAREPTGG